MTSVRVFVEAYAHTSGGRTRPRLRLGLRDGNHRNWGVAPRESALGIAIRAGPSSPRYGHFLVPARLRRQQPYMAQNGPKRASEGAQQGAAVPRLCTMRARLATKHHRRAPGCSRLTIPTSLSSLLYARSTTDTTCVCMPGARGVPSGGGGGGFTKGSKWSSIFHAPFFVVHRFESAAPSSR